jgi:hypothetical protein
MFGKKLSMLMLGVVLASSKIVGKSTLENENSVLNKKDRLR